MTFCKEKNSRLMSFAHSSRLGGCIYYILSLQHRSHTTTGAWGSSPTCTAGHWCNTSTKFCGTTTCGGRSGPGADSRVVSNEFVWNGWKSVGFLQLFICFIRPIEVGSLRVSGEHKERPKMSCWSGWMQTPPRRQLVAHIWVSKNQQQGLLILGVAYIWNIFQLF